MIIKNIEEFIYEEPKLLTVTLEKWLVNRTSEIL